MIEDSRLSGEIWLQALRSKSVMAGHPSAIEDSAASSTDVKLNFSEISDGQLPLPRSPRALEVSWDNSSRLSEIKCGRGDEQSCSIETSVSCSHQEISR